MRIRKILLSHISSIQNWQTTKISDAARCSLEKIDFELNFRSHKCDIPKNEKYLGETSISNQRYYSKILFSSQYIELFRMGGYNLHEYLRRCKC